MQLAEVIRELEQAGTAQTRKTYARHGIGPNMYGVSYAHLNKLARRIKIDPRLAEQLWKTGNHDCQALALRIASADEVKKSTLRAWSRSIGSGCAAGDFAKFAARTPHAVSLAAEWCAAHDPLRNQIGWYLIAALAAEEPSDELDEMFAACIDAIAQNIHSEENHTRHAMNSALIAVGGRTAALRKHALAAAKHIGKVHVDHGDTSCKTPDAAAAIVKTWARKSASRKQPK